MASRNGDQLTLIIRLIKYAVMIRPPDHQMPRRAAPRRRADARGTDPRRAEAVRRQGLRRHLDARDRGRGQGQYRLDRLSFRRQGRAARRLRRLSSSRPSRRSPARRSADGSCRRQRRRRRRRAQLFAALERMVAFIVASPEAGEIVQFVLRELAQPTAALDRIYDGVFEPTHARLCQIWEQATGEAAESEAHQAHRVHADRPGRLFPHRPRGGDAPHGLERRSAPAEAAAVVGGRQGQSRRHPRRPERGKVMSFLCSHPARRLAVFGAARRPAPLAVGYVEGDYVLLAPIEVAQVETVSVKRGDRVEAGARRWPSWKAPTPRSPSRRPKRRSPRPQAQLADLQIGKRPEEIAVLKATVRHRPRRRPTEAKRVLARASRPVQARHRHAGRLRRGRRRTLEMAEAQVGQAEANLAVGRPAGARRDDQGRRQPGQAGAGGAGAGAAGGCRSARSRRRRRAASTTSSAIPATSPGRPRR